MVSQVSCFSCFQYLGKAELAPALFLDRHDPTTGNQPPSAFLFDLQTGKVGWWSLEPTVVFRVYLLWYIQDTSEPMQVLKKVKRVQHG